MAEVKSAYNFVPVSEKVYFPQWANEVSMDIPFRDGLSGRIELEMTAQTPVFVCNGHKNEGDKEKKTEDFSQYKGRYFIPATSIKGMVRNLLGVMSFGKMKTDPRARFAQREWGNHDLYPLIKEQLKAGFHCGWLKPKERQLDSDYTTYEIIDCGKPYRISHKEIDKIIDDRKLEHYFSKQSKFDITKTFEGYDPKTAYFKYQYIVRERDFLVGYSFREFNASNRKVLLDDDGNIEGTIVLTGQPDKWEYPRSEKAKGKFYEFVFKDYDQNSKRHPLTEEEFENFCFIYENSDDWKLAKERLKEEGIPVFFRLDKGGKIKNFGLAYLYKLPYEHTPQECLSMDHRRTVENPDLKECIFGYSENIEQGGKSKINESLRGRVQFTHAFAVGLPEIDKKQTLILGSPKASYYPFYINQKDGSRGNINGNYRTYNEHDSRLSGWKRYPMRETTWSKKMDSPKLDTNIVPLKTGSTFKCYVNFHNLKPIELGALLSTLTYHNTPNCFHQLGQAKPYGFGRMQFEAKLTGGLNGKEEELMAHFELEMDKFLGSSWNQSFAVKELYTLTSVLIKNEERFKYPELKIDDKEGNDFVNYKGGSSRKGPKYYLENFSIITRKTFAPKSLSMQYKEQFEQELAKEALSIADRAKKRSAESKRQDEEMLRKEEEEREKEKNRIEAELREKELAKIRETELAEKERLMLQTEKLDAGIKVELEKKDNAGNYRIQNFKNLKDRCDGFLKKQKQLTSQSGFNDKDANNVHDALLRLSQNRDKKEAKQWINFDDKFMWGSVRSWVGDDIAKQWFDEFNK